MKFNHTAHKALWDWLAENPDREKEDWIGWEENGGDIDFDVENDCFACEYTVSENLGEPHYCDCDKCPLDWEAEDCLSGLYGEWSKAKFYQKSSCSRLARQIANLPVKPGVECE